MLQLIITMSILIAQVIATFYEPKSFGIIMMLSLVCHLLNAIYITLEADSDAN